MFNEIPINEFLHAPFNQWLNEWFLLTSGDLSKNDFNCMTVAWGSMGTMWNKPFIQVVVRPTRYTYEFTEKYDSFTLTSFELKYRDKLKLLGTKSGRDTDKISEAGLTPMASKLVKSPGYKEAYQIFECRKIYFDDFEPDNFLDKKIFNNYPLKDYHRIYFGEVLRICVQE